LKQVDNMRQTSASLKSLTVLDRLIDEASRTDQLRLPTIKQLAALAKVSYSAMQRAVRALRDSGQLAVSHGKGTRALPPPSSAVGLPDAVSPDTPPSTKWMRISRVIERDILNGGFQPGSVFPSIKELARRYGANYRTVRKALDAIEQNGAVRVQGNRISPSLPPARRHSAVIVLIVAGDTYHPGDASVTSTRVHDNLRSLEIQCAHIGVRLEICTCNATTGRILTQSGRFITPGSGAFPDREEVLGFMVWDRGIPTETTLTGIVCDIRRIGKPLAILDERGLLHYSDPLFSGRQIRIFPIGQSRACGVQMGRFLLDSGHRAVAFFSHMHAARYLNERMAGIAGVFNNAGFHNAVKGFVIPHTSITSPTPSRFGRALARLLDREERRTAPDDVQTFMEIASLRETAMPALEWEWTRKELEPLFEKALSQTRFTAWMGINDKTALACLSFLRRHKVRVPKEISVAGFDDELEALRARLTSFNFNSSAIIRAMISHILAHGKPTTLRAAGNVVEIEGTIVVRQTTGPAP
jgi:DNA-binding transcriptional regulator YhcF (GntR family)